MNLGDNIVLKEIALFSQTEAEEAAMVMRYFYNKEGPSEKKVRYQECLEKLERHLMLTYEKQTNLQIPPVEFRG